MIDIVETIRKAVRDHQAGRLTEAEQQYQLVLKSEPDKSVALYSLGLLFLQTSRYKEAVELVNKAIAKNPQVPQFHNTLGLAFESLGRFEEAMAAYRQAVLLKHDYAEAYHNMGIALHSQGQFAAAIEKCKLALSFQPDYAQAYNTIGYALQMQEQFDEAIEAYQQAVRLKPDYAEAYNHLGVVLNAQKRYDQALDSYTKALQLDPDYIEAYNNIGVVWHAKGQFTEAVAAIEQALRINPEFAEAYYNLGNILKEQRKCAEAIKSYNQAIQLKPDYADAHWNLANTLLLNGDFTQGWQEYQWRQKTRWKNIVYPHDHSEPRWDGSSFAGKRLFVHCEQGLGDTLQFIRYLPMVKALGGTVIFTLMQPLISLLDQFEGIDKLVVLSSDKPDVKFDFYISLMDLPAIFRTTLDSIPDSLPYVYADSTKSDYWRTKLDGPDFKVGIVWAGSPKHENDHNRSCMLKYFAPLASIEGVRLYSLQKDASATQLRQFPAEMVLANPAEEFEDFTDTAAVIENLDLVISVDTAIVHLAGAMGKSVWTLLPFAPDWRWMLDRDDSPWYPTMRLFRQEKWGDWDTVFARVAEQLRILTENHIAETSLTNQAG